jgi:hypothetical protein
MEEKTAFEDAFKINQDLLTFKETLNNNLEYKGEDNKEELDNTKKLEEFYKECEKKYEKFFYSFPIVAKLIIFSGMYSDVCLVKFFKYYYEFKDLPKTYDEYVDRQTEYIYIFNVDIINQLSNKPGIRKLKKDVLENKAKQEKEKMKKKLIEEYETFMKMMSEVKENKVEEEMKNKRQRLQIMLEELKKKSC